MVRITLLIFLVFSKASLCYCQGNSFAKIYKQNNSTITYKYDSLNQTHNYSGNWDFDLDGTADEVYFVGTGGAHLYYYLKVVLSNDNRRKEFRYIQSDFPIFSYPDKNGLNYDPIEALAQFTVADFDGDKKPDIYIRLDNQSFLSAKKSLKKHRIRTQSIILSFVGSKAILRDYKNSK